MDLLHLRVRESDGPKIVRGKTEHAQSLEKLGSNLVGSKYFEDGEVGCFCKELDPLYPWEGMVKHKMAVPLEHKSICEVVTKRKPSLCSDDEVRVEKKRKLGN